MGSAGCQSNQQVEDRLVAAFSETMFDAGPSAHGQGEMFSTVGSLAKWDSPVVVSVVEGNSPENDDIARKALAELADLGGIAVEWVEPGASGIEMHIHFGAEREYIINGNQLASCYTRIGGAADGRLKDVDIYISADGDGGWRTDCLTHELLHGMGWRGHTHRLRSAISYAHGETGLTKWDRMIMRALYDPRLPPGIAKADAIPIARAIFHGMLEE